MKLSKFKSIRVAFTLIELLVVIAIIAILIG
ncbi:MAG: prepilin-type N-terminal cleavage/methylation domain-containing protein, partial [Gemmataceae bacterium]|nr:prepilin-type N-terminal cleavage/methylation domain-containing protein [Gemmataceae bacterium]